jgi:hypothetical protein
LSGANRERAFPDDEGQKSMSRKKKVVAVAAVLAVAACVVGVKGYASINPSCEPGEAMGVTSNPSLTFCTKTVSLMPSKANH